jgi:hypothetical protein
MTDTQPILTGKLAAYFETGCEGIYWSFYEDGKTGYDALVVLKKGDVLQVFNDAARTQEIFHAAVDLEFESHKEKSAYSDSREQQAVSGYWVHGLQKDIDRETWSKMFFDEKPAYLTVKNPTL